MSKRFECILDFLKSSAKDSLGKRSYEIQFYKSNNHHMDEHVPVIFFVWFLFSAINIDALAEILNDMLL
jgi:hypothetical protein